MAEKIICKMKPIMVEKDKYYKGVWWVKFDKDGPLFILLETGLGWVIRISKEARKKGLILRR